MATYKIKEGRAVTSKKMGILVGGDVVTPDLLGGGKVAFDRLLASGYFVSDEPKKKEPKKK